MLEIWVDISDPKTVNVSRYLIMDMQKMKKSTINSSQVDYFSSLKDVWWKPEVEGMLEKYNFVRVPFVCNGLVSPTSKHNRDHPLKGKEILDVGCGGGVLSEGIAKLGAKVTGIDLSEGLIHVARAHADISLPDNKPIYHLTSIEEHAEHFENHYDGVVASEVIEHVDDPQLFVKSCVRALKPGGKIFFTTPNRTRISQFVFIFLYENVFKSIPKGMHQYDKFITPKELIVILEQNNCRIQSFHGILYNPITKKFSYTKYPHVLYAIQAKKN